MVQLLQVPLGLLQMRFGDIPGLTDRLQQHCRERSFFGGGGLSDTRLPEEAHICRYTPPPSSLRRFRRRRVLGPRRRCRVHGDVGGGGGGPRKPAGTIQWVQQR